MRRNSEKQLNETPVKKWLRMSPLQEDLAIIESESSDHNQEELFNELVGRTPSFREDSPVSEMSPCSEEYSEDDPFSVQSSSEDGGVSADTVNEMKEEAPVGGEKRRMEAVDLNRKGCNCRNSKC
jgi:hypothetical protein